MEKIKIKCPNCGKILMANINPGASSQGVTIKCPVCKVSNLFSSFKLIKPTISEEEDRTNLGPNLCSEDKTCLPEFNKVEKIGHLRDSNNSRYNLKEGVNLIGRMTYQSAPVATVPIRTDDRGFSRKHMNIEVLKGSDHVFRYYIYNAENKNPTTVNGVPIGANDKIILHDGDRIKSSSTELVMKIE